MNREDLVALYDSIIAKNPNFERKGKTMPYTSANGHMFSQVNKEAQLGIRLSPEDTKAFDADFSAKPFLSYGATMREYVLVPQELLENPSLLGSYLQKSYEYVMSLPTK